MSYLKDNISKVVQDYIESKYKDERYFYTILTIGTLEELKLELYKKIVSPYNIQKDFDKSLEQISHD